MRKDTGGDGWADVWKRHHFAWEYKGRRADLDAAFDQLRQYSLALENPPLLIVSDMVRFRIRTNWTNSVSRTHEFELEDLADASTRDRLTWAFSDLLRQRRERTRQVQQFRRRQPAGCWSAASTVTLNTGRRLPAIARSREPAHGADLVDWIEAERVNHMLNPWRVALPTTRRLRANSCRRG